MPNALPAATLPLYPGLGQAPNILACIPSGVIYGVMASWQATGIGIGSLLAFCIAAV